MSPWTIAVIAFLAGIVFQSYAEIAFEFVVWLFQRRRLTIPTGADYADTCGPGCTLQK